MEERNQVRRRRLFESVELQLRRVRAGRRRFECLNRLLDGLLIFRHGHGNQVLVLYVERQLGVRCQILQQSQGRRRIGLFDRIDGQFGSLVRRRSLQIFVDRRLDGRVVRRRCEHDQPFVLRIDRDFRFGNLRLENRHQIGRRFFCEGVKLQRGRVRVGLGRLQFLQRGLDRQVLLGRRHGHDVFALRVKAQRGVWHERLQ